LVRSDVFRFKACLITGLSFARPARFKAKPRKRAVAPRALSRTGRTKEADMGQRSGASPF
jgi:hypothetical protein